MTIATKLSEARKLIERGWCRGPFATDAEGNSVAVASSDATCFCALGATWRVDLKDTQMDSLLTKAIGRQDVGAWNDAPERTQAEVIEAFKRAEQLARDGAE